MMMMMNQHCTLTGTERQTQHLSACSRSLYKLDWLLTATTTDNDPHFLFCSNGLIHCMECMWLPYNLNTESAKKFKTPKQLQIISYQ